MGLTRLSVTVAKPSGRRGASVKCIVDTGATYSLINGDTLRKLGIRPTREISLILADGSDVTRKVGEAKFQAAGITGTSPVIFGEKGDENLLGVVTLEVMGLFLDPLQRQLKPLKFMAAGAGRMRGECE